MRPAHLGRRGPKVDGWAIASHSKTAASASSFSRVVSLITSPPIIRRAANRSKNELIE